MAVAVPIAVNGGTIFIVFVIVMILALAFTSYTRKGSGIDEHPTSGGDSAPGSDAPSEMTGGRTSEDHPPSERRNVGDTFGSRGTR
jgi:hypothetical protein